MASVIGSLLVGFIVGAYYHVLSRRFAERQHDASSRTHRALILRVEELLASADPSHARQHKVTAKLNAQPPSRRRHLDNECVQYRLYHLYEAAKIAERNGLSDELMAILREWSALDPSDPELLVRVADELWGTPIRGDSDEEIDKLREERARKVRELYDQAVENSLEDETVALKRRAHYCLHFGSIRDALKDLEEVLRRSPKDANATYYLAYYRYERNELQAAERHIDAFTAFVPKNWKGHLLRSQILKDLGRHDEAAEAQAMSEMLDEGWRRRRGRMGMILSAVSAVPLISLIIVHNFVELGSWSVYTLLLLCAATAYGGFATLTGVSETDGWSPLSEPYGPKLYRFVEPPAWFDAMLPGPKWFVGQHVVDVVNSLPNDGIEESEQDGGVAELLSRIARRQP